MRRSHGTRVSGVSGTAAEREGDAWGALAAAIRDAPSAWSCAAFGELYALAIVEGRRVLRGLRGLDDARREDLAIEALLAKLPEVVSAERPRAFFRTVLWRDAISWMRSGRSRLATADEPAEPSRYDEGPYDAEEASAIYRVDARQRLDALDARELEVMLADAWGEAREAIARAVGTSRANVDQIISRARRRSGS